MKGSAKVGVVAMVVGRCAASCGTFAALRPARDYVGHYSGARL